VRKSWLILVTAVPSAQPGSLAERLAHRYLQSREPRSANDLIFALAASTARHPPILAKCDPCSRDPRIGRTAAIAG